MSDTVTRFDGVTVRRNIAEAEERIPDGWKEVTIKFKQSSLASGKQTFTVNLGSGSQQMVKQVIISVGDTGDEWGPDGYFQVHRTDGTPDESDPSDTLLGEHYFNESNILIIDKPKASSAALKIVMDHNAGTAKDVRGSVKYYYK